MKRIMIIEDDDSIASLEKDYLEISGYEVIVATDGQVGYDMVVSGKFDCLIVDIMLPSLDGFKIIKGIRERMDIPIIVVSAKSEDFDKVRGLGLGANDYMTKPFSPSELYARVKSHIGYYDKLKGVGNHQKVYTFKGLEINHDSHLVLVNNKPIKLTTKEYDLLWYFVSHPGKVFSKETLFDEIWGLDPLGDTATVAVHVQRIRKKIEKDPGNPEYIETLWGTGYRFMGSK